MKKNVLREQQVIQIFGVLNLTGTNKQPKTKKNELETGAECQATEIEFICKFDHTTSCFKPLITYSPFALILKSRLLTPYWALYNLFSLTCLPLP